MKRHSLFFGVDSYTGDSGLRPLRCAVRDAEELARLFGDPNYAGEATAPVVKLDRSHDEAKSDVGEFLRKSELDPRKDLIHLHFSGHGALDDNGRFYLCFQDSRLDDLTFTAVAYRDLEAWLDARLVKRALVTLDCCYAGAAFNKAKAGGLAELSKLERKLEPDAAGARGWYVISAGGETELAMEGEDLSLFTRHLIEGVRSGAADSDGKGYVTAGDLHAYVRTSLAQETVGQRPMISGTSDGPLTVALNPIALRKRIEDEEERKRIAAAKHIAEFRIRVRDALYERIRDRTFTAKFAGQVEDFIEGGGSDLLSGPRYDLICRFLDGSLYATEFRDAWASTLNQIPPEMPPILPDDPKGGQAKDRTYFVLSICLMAAWFAIYLFSFAIGRNVFGIDDYAYLNSGFSGIISAGASYFIFEKHSRHGELLWNKANAFLVFAFLVGFLFFLILENVEELVGLQTSGGAEEGGYQLIHLLGYTFEVGSILFVGCAAIAVARAGFRRWSPPT